MTGKILLLIAALCIAPYGFSEAFSQAPAATIGTVFSDVNKNDMRDAGEAGLEGIRVACVPHGQLDDLLQSTTDGTGAYRFETGSGCYLLQADMPDWNTGDPTFYVYLSGQTGQTVTHDFASWQTDQCLPGYDLTGGQCVDASPPPPPTPPPTPPPPTPPPTPPPPTCGPDQELVNGQCVDSQLPPPPSTCGPDQELVNGQCVDRTPVGPDVSELANAIKALTAAIQEIKQKLAEQDEKIAGLSTLASQIEEAEQTIATQNAEIAMLEQMVDILDQSIEDQGDFIVTYHDASTAHHTEIKEWFQSRSFLEKFSDRLNLTLVLPHDVHLTMDECDEANAFWYPSTYTAVVCYEYVSYLYDLLDSVYLEEYVWEKVDAAATFTMLHELGHGLIDVYDLPIVGREEDAVDQFATIVALEYMDYSEGIEVIDATLEAYRESSKSQDITIQYLQGRHSLDEQRLYNILCWTYGSDPLLYLDLQEWFSDFELTEDRLASCEYDYYVQSRNWYEMLSPFLMDADILPPGTYPQNPYVVYAYISHPHEVTIIFSEPVIADLTDFTDLNISGLPRNLVDITGSGTEFISLMFAGSAAPYGASGSIDIASTVTDLDGNALDPIDDLVFYYY